MKFITIVSLSLFLTMTTVRAADDFRFLCYATQDDFNGFLKLETQIEAAISIQGNKATLYAYDLIYKMFDGEDLWTEAYIETDAVVLNNPNYRPRVYKEHFQFDISQGVNGTVKLLIPFNAGNTYDDRFMAVLILTHIDDHAGDSVQLECSID